MKISTIKQIIEQEVVKVIQEQKKKNNNITKNLKDLFLPKIAQDPIATKIFKLTYKGFKDKKISVSELYNVSNALYVSLNTGDKQFARKTLTHNNALKRLGIDVEIGDITKTINDPAMSRVPDNLKGPQVDFGKTYGIQFTLSI